MFKLSPPEAGSYAGSVVSIGSVFTLSQWGMIFGIVTAFLTFVLNVWYTRKKNAREQEERETNKRLAHLEELERIARLTSMGVKV